GRKGRDHFARRGRPIHAEYMDLGDDIDFLRAREISRALTDLYVSGQFDEVNLIYTQFLSVGSQRPTLVRLLPLSGLDAAKDGAGSEDPAAGGSEGEPLEYIYEPSPAEVLGLLLPRHVDMQVYRAL